jgi:aminoglycoside phosphotransferase (APT) family kinase protein
MAPEIPAADDLSPPPGWALERVPGLEHGQAPRRVAALPGGSVNRVYRVDSGAGCFVLRLDGAAWRRPGVDRGRELLLHRAAAAGGIAPAIVYAAPEQDGLLITQYCEGRVLRPEEFGCAQTLERLGERLYALHRLPAPAVAAFDPLAVAQAYVQSIEAQWRTPGDEREGASGDASAGAAARAAVLERLAACCATLRTLGQEVPGIVHGDLTAGNLLQGERLWLLDWEYAQAGHPVLDLACVFAYYPQAAAHRARFAAAAGLAAPAEGELMRAAEFVYRALSWLWHQARGEYAPAP